MLLLATAPCLAGDFSLVISQVYVNDWFSQRQFRSNYAELLNVGSQTVALDGLSVQAAYGSNSWSAIPLSENLRPGQHYLVEITSESPYANVALPDPDALGPGLLSSFIGSVVIIRGTSPLNTTWPSVQQTLDLFAYGRLDTVYNGRPFVGPLGTMAFLRKQAGCQNTEDNAADFYSAPPDPHNSKAPPTPCPASALAPIIGPAGIRHAATLRPGPLAPGTLAIVDGRRFIDGHTQVLFDSSPAPIYAVTPERLLLSVPKQLAGKTSANMIVRVDGRVGVHPKNETES